MFKLVSALIVLQSSISFACTTGLIDLKIACAQSAMECNSSTAWGATSLKNIGNGLHDCIGQVCNPQPGYPDTISINIYTENNCGSKHNSDKNAPSSSNAPNMCGSIVQTQNQVLGERIKLQGSTFDLIYMSNRVVGYQGAYRVSGEITNEEIKTDVTGYSLYIYDESSASVYTNSYSNVVDQSYSYVFDGLTSTGVESWASLKYKTKLVEHFAGFDSELEKYHDLGMLKVKKLGLGGWAPTVWMFYDSSAKMLYKGDGSLRKVVAQTISGGYRIQEEDGSLVYDFDSQGLITSTKLGITGTAIYTFSYSGGKLTAITEPNSMVSNFTYTSGVLSSFTNQYGQVFTVSMDGNGYMDELTTPGSASHQMSYSTGGLLLSYVKPTGEQNDFTYSADGMLERDQHSGGFYADVADIGLDPYLNLPAKTYTTKMGRVTKYAGNSDETSGRYISNPWGGQSYQAQNDIGTNFVTNGVVNSATLAPDIRFGADATSQVITQSVKSIPTGYQFIVNQTDTYNPSTPTDPFTFTSWTKNFSSGTINSNSVYTTSNKEWNTTSAVGRTSRLRTDSLQRPIEYQTGTLTKYSFTYTGNHLTSIDRGTRNISATYSSSTGLLSSVTNPKGEVTSYSYDSNGNPNILTLPDARTVDFDYDAYGRLVSVTPYGRSAHVFNFNASEMPSEYAPPLISGVPNVKTQYVYNDDNQLTQINRPDGLTLAYDYDATTGLMSTITTPTRTISLGYAYQTNLVNYYDTNAGIDIERTLAGPEISSEVMRDNSGNVLGSFGVTFSSTYPERTSDYAAGGNSGSRTITYVYDNDRVLKGTGDISLAYSMPNGTLSSSAMGSGSTAASDSYGYNSFGEMTSYGATYGGSSKYSLALTRDALGRITQKVEFIVGIATDTYDYTYDSVGRLTQVNKNSVTSATYSYDDNSNRTGGSIGGTTTSATYNSQDRMSAYNVFTYTYNANGDLKTKTNTLTSEVWTYNYDVQGNLLSVTLPNAHVISYEVDGLNRVVGRKYNSTLTKRFIYDGQYRIIGELNSSRNLTRRYVYVSKQNIPDYFYEGSVKYRIFSDHLGSPRLVIKVSDGTIMQKLQHDEFGRVISDSNPGYIPFGFAGGLYDKDTKLVRFGARDYDPETGRWLSKDPILFEGGDANLYGYVINDPVNKIDPTGKSWGIPIAIGIVVIGEINRFAYYYFGNPYPPPSEPPYPPPPLPPPGPPGGPPRFPFPAPLPPVSPRAPICR